MKCRSYSVDETGIVERTIAPPAGRIGSLALRYKVRWLKSGYRRDKNGRRENGERKIGAVLARVSSFPTSDMQECIRAAGQAGHGHGTRDSRALTTRLARAILLRLLSLSSLKITS